jgi:hypothetical protein
MTTKFSAIGIVLGNTWGGGSGGYSTVVIEADTKEELLEIANKKLNDGSLDAGMGFESLIGAKLMIKKSETIEIDGKLFTHTESEIELIGNLTDEQADFLYDCF